MIEIGPNNLAVMGRDIGLVSALGHSPILRAHNPEDAGEIYAAIRNEDASHIQFDDMGCWFTAGSKRIKMAYWLSKDRPGPDLWHDLWRDHGLMWFHDRTWVKWEEIPQATEDPDHDPYDESQ